MSIYAVFFGGYHASRPNMDAWKISAEKQRGDVKFEACPYPEHVGSGRKSAVHGFEKQFDAVIKMIADYGADTLFIVGHSSGCAIADELNSRLDGDHSHITLVDLDGFAPTADQIKKSKVEAWYAEGARGGRSYNWAKGNKMFIAASATHEWSLHFSLVNTAATNAITKDTYREKGYAGGIANLC